MEEAGPVERALIAAAGLETTAATHPAEVLAALRAAAALRARLIRPESPAEEPAIAFRAVRA
jgi:hypothetical protein